MYQPIETEFNMARDFGAIEYAYDAQVAAADAEVSQ